MNIEFDIIAPDPVPELVNCATVAGDGPDDWPEDNTACVSFPVNPSGPNLAVEKWHDWNGDGQLQYNIRFLNIGDQTIGDVWITDTMPASTSWNGWWELYFDWSRLVGGDVIATDNQLMWHVSELYPGDQGQIQFQVGLEFPGEPLIWYTNTVQITEPPGDTDPSDNFYEDIAFSGPEISRVDLNVYSDNIWGYAAVGPLTITTQYEEAYFGGGDFDWYANFPFLPGEVVTLTAGTGQLPVIIEIPEPFDVEGSSVTNVVQGQIDHLYSEWIEVGLDGGPDIHTQTYGDGFFKVLFDDIPRGGSGVVRYRTLVDYTDVTFQRGWSSPDLILEVNYGHDWVQGSYEPGHTVWITVTESDGSTPKGTAELQTHDFGGWTGFSTDDGWTSPRPDIIPGDWVFGRVDNGFTATVHIGTIEGELDVDADTISGTVTADSAGELLNAQCGVWQEGGPGYEFQVDPDGGSYFCDFGDEGWDLTPGQQVGVQYQDPEQNWVVNVFEEPAPYLGIDKWAGGNPAEGGNLEFTINYWNDGGAPAEDVVITETLQGMSYLYDTSPFTVVTATIPGGEVVVYAIDTVEPGQGQEFRVFVEVIESESQPITNTAFIATSNPYDQGDPGEKTAEWSGHVQGNDTHLNVGKWSWTGDPAPDTEIVFNVNVCNNGDTGSSEVTLTDDLHPALSLVTWWDTDQDWYEVYSDTNRLTIAKPSISSWSCSNVNIVASVPPDAQPGDYITNTASITASNDLDPEDNFAFWEGQVNDPHTNLHIDKWFNNGQLVPGGLLDYGIGYRNDGNVPVDGPIYITDTLPISTTFIASWRHGELYTPTLVTDEFVVWEIDDLPNGAGDDFGFVLRVDEEAAPGTILENKAEISRQPVEDSYEDNEAYWVEELFEHGPNLRVRKYGSWDDWGPDTRRASYELIIENIGDVRVDDVMVADDYPEGMVMDGGIDTEWWRLEDWGDDSDAGVFTATYQWLEPGGTTWLNFGAIVSGVNELPFGLIFTNTVEVPEVQDETNIDDNVDQVVLSTGPDLYIEKELVAGDLLPGELITFMLTFGNDRHGHEWWWNMQHNAVLTDVLPTGLEFVSAALHNCFSDGLWCDAPPDQDGDVLVWDLWPIGSGGRNEIALTVRITDTAEGDDVFANWAEIQSSEPMTDVEPFYDNNVDRVDVVIALPKFEVSKVYESSEVAGMTIAYTVTVENTGSEPGTNVVLSDTLPVGLDYGGGDGSFDGTAVTWTFPEILEDGGTASGTFTATLPCTGTIANDNYLVVSSDQGVASMPGETVSFDVIAPTIDVSLSHTPEPIVVGSTVYFTATGVTDGTTLTYTWDYGDGEFGSGEFTSHSYTSDVAYNIVLTATDSCLYESTTTAELNIDPPALAASFDQSASAIPIHSMVYFTDTSTTDGPAIVAWEWDFGDGSATTATQDASHLYSAFGTFDVTLVVTDELGYSDSVLVVDAVSTLAPVFEIGKEYESSEVAGTLVTYTLTFTNIGSLTGTGLVITDALPANVTWVSGGSYDDGTGIISWARSSLSPGTDESVQFVGQLGCSGQVVNDSYQVASSDQGSSSPIGDPVSFTIQAPTMTASFIQSAAEVRVGDNVVFTSTSTTNGAAIVSWLWDFGDGETDSGEIVTYAYDEAGEYDVELTVQDACGNSDTITMTNAVAVEEADYYIFIPFLNKP